MCYVSLQIVGIPGIKMCHDNTWVNTNESWVYCPDVINTDNSDIVSFNSETRESLMNFQIYSPSDNECGEKTEILNDRK